MHKYLFPGVYLAASAAHGILAEDFNLASLLTQRNTPVLGDVCRSLRQACNIKLLPDTIEVCFIVMASREVPLLIVHQKLCNENCEESIDAGDLKDELCGKYKKVRRCVDSKSLGTHH